MTFQKNDVIKSKKQMEVQMKKYIFILFIALLVSSDSYGACPESLMQKQIDLDQKVIKKALKALSESEFLRLKNALLNVVHSGFVVPSIDHPDRSVSAELAGHASAGFIPGIGYLDGERAVRELLEAGIDVNDRNTFIRHLVEVGINIEDALLYALDGDLTELARLLREASVDVNDRNTFIRHLAEGGINIESALLYALDGDRTELARLLKEAGATE